MDKFDFPEWLDGTLSGIIEIIYFYIITIILYIKSPLKTWDKIYNEILKSPSEFDFRTIGLSQPTMFYTMSIIVFLFLIKILIFINFLNIESFKISKESQTFILKLIESITNVYEFNVTVFVFVLLLINLMFSISYLYISIQIKVQLNNINERLTMYGQYIKKIFKINFEWQQLTKIAMFKILPNLRERQKNLFSVDWTDINSIHRFIAISNFISGLLILFFIAPFVVAIRYPDSEFIIYSITIILFSYAFVPAWLMSNYLIQNDES